MIGLAVHSSPYNSAFNMSLNRYVCCAFEKCRMELEKGRIIGVYEASYFKDIFPENVLEKYLRELEKI